MVIPWVVLRLRRTCRNSDRNMLWASMMASLSPIVVRVLRRGWALLRREISRVFVMKRFWRVRSGGNVEEDSGSLGWSSHVSCNKLRTCQVGSGFAVAAFMILCCILMRKKKRKKKKETLLVCCIVASCYGGTGTEPIVQNWWFSWLPYPVILLLFSS